MNIKPILFNTPMVQSIMEGRKTQTRRVVKLNLKDPKEPFHHNEGEIVDSKPKYSLGDILWVRETYTDNGLGYYRYKADGWPEGKGTFKGDHIPDNFRGKWKPSIFMPKQACRNFLKVTNIRIERLQDISREDCLREGIKREIFPENGEEVYYFYPCNDLRDDSYLDFPETSFYSLWKSINGKKSWNANPYVWVYDFERTEKPKNFI